MIAHLIHDSNGNIRAVVFQSTEIQGELGIQTDKEGELVTALDLSEIYPEINVDTPTDSERSRHHLHLIARDICSGFRIDVRQKRLERLASAKADEEPSKGRPV